MIGIIGLLIVIGYVLGIIGFFSARTNARRIESLEAQLRRANAYKEVKPRSQQEQTSQEIIRSTPEHAPEVTEELPEEAPEETPEKPDEPVTHEPEEPVEPQPSPWVAARKAAQRPPPENLPPHFIDRLVANFNANWIIWIAGLSLALGGLFIVQYSIEAGLLGPAQRVMIALLFGAALIAAAEFIRRKSEQGIAEPFTVSVALAAGGVATLFGAVMSAHTLYGLTGPTVGFISIAVVSLLGMAGGLIYGPVLAVIGLLGAFATPFFVSGNEPSPILFGYFIIVYAACLAVERRQKWIWLSALGVTFALAWAVLLTPAFWDLPLSVLYIGAIIVATITIPAFGVPPSWHSVQMVSPKTLDAFTKHYPTLLVVISTLAATVLLVLLSGVGLVIWQASILLLVLFLYGSILALPKAQNLDQLAPIFALGLLALIVAGPNLLIIEFYNINSRPAVVGLADQFLFVGLVTIAVIIALVICALWRAQRSVRSLYWIVIAAIAPLIYLPALWSFWQTSAPLNDGQWAIIAIVAAVFQGVVGAGFFKSKDAPILPTSLFALSSLILVLMATLLYLSGTVLTLAIALLGLVAIGLVYQYSLVLVQWFAILMVVFAGLRLVIYPGLDWALRAELIEVLIAYGGSIAIFAVASKIAARAKQDAALLFFETAAFSTAAVTLCVLGARWLDTTSRQSLVGMALYGMVWLVLAATQFYRAQRSESLVAVRKTIGALYLGLSGLMLVITLSVFNPLFVGRITGSMFLNEMTFAYLVPAVLLYLVVKYVGLSQFKINRYVPAALAGFYLILEIRHFWHGPNLRLPGVLQVELYTYTIVLLLLSLVLIVYSIMRRDQKIRTIGLGMVAVTVVKVFLWDMSGLQGLDRAGAFIGLGLSLAGIAWLHQHFGLDREDKNSETPDQ